MSKPSVNVLFNVSGNDVECTNPAGDSNFTLLGAEDFIIWRDAQQMGGDFWSEASYPTIIPESGDSEANKMFLMVKDGDDYEYNHVQLAGSSKNGGLGGNNRYVCTTWFSGATATIPYLEAYDDYTRLTSESPPLGDGTPANSCFKAVATTNGAPGSAPWEGTALSGIDLRVALDVGALVGAKYLYWNMKQVLSDWMASWPTTDWYNNDLVFAIHFTYS